MKPPPITAGPWRVLKDVRLGQGNRKIADQWWLDSPTRKAMCVAEVWELTPKAWQDRENAKEQRQTLKEVEANMTLNAAAPALLAFAVRQWNLMSCLPSSFMEYRTLEILHHVLKLAGCTFDPTEVNAEWADVTPVQFRLQVRGYGRNHHYEELIYRDEHEARQAYQNKINLWETPSVHVWLERIHCRIELQKGKLVLVRSIHGIMEQRRPVTKARRKVKS